MKADANPVVRILKVYLALMVLLVLTASASRLRAGWYSTPIALIAAIAKLTLIFWFFMNLSRQRALVRIFAVAGFFWLAVLIVLAASDYLTRGWSY